MKTYASLCILGALVAASCLEKFELPEVADTGGMGGAAAVLATPRCGGTGETCCAEPLTPCDAQLRCDETSLTCVTEEARLCTGVEQCHPGQTCCPSGLLSSCVTVAAGGTCPTPDLVVVTTQETLSLQREERTFDPTSPEDACAIEKGCVSGPGNRRLLRFSIQVENQGDAELVLGDPGRTPGFAFGACDGRPYLPNYLSYELVDIAGVPVPGASTRMPARCQNLPEGFSSRFGCELWGLWRDFRETYAGGPCQWVDITEVPPGDYVLRVTVNPDAVIDEPNSGNRRDFEVTIPDFATPSQGCAQANEPAPAGALALLGPVLSIERECGWSIPSTTPTWSCIPGEQVTLECPLCEAGPEGTADPMMRICEGATPCSSGAALADGSDTWRLRCGDQLSEDLSDSECSLLMDQAVASGACQCEWVSSCPTVRFICPTSGSYTTMMGAFAADEPFSCDARPRLPGTGAQ